ncbi:MAG: copper amine oxidase N-terminal domain-containing protein [Paenibacillaceae bacterium]
MKRLVKKQWIPSLIIVIALLVFPLLFSGHAALADDDREEHHVKYEKDQMEDKEVRETTIRKHEREDDEDDDDDEGEEFNETIEGGFGDASTLQPSLTPSFVNGQSASIQVDGQSASLNVTLSVGQGGGSEVRVNTEKVLDYLNVPYVKYSKGSLLEMYVDERHVIFHDGKSIAYVNGQKYSLPAAPVSQNGQLLIPLNVLANQLGYSLQWDDNTQIFLLKRGV